MAADPTNPYELLGVSHTASAREIRRAYRRRVVATHRSGVLGLIEQLDELRAAYDALKDDAGRNAIEPGGTRTEARALSPRAPPRTAVGVRSEAARELQRYSIRVGRQAQRENAETVRGISDEYDRDEAAERRIRERRARLRVAVRLFWVTALVALAVAAARSL